MRDEPQQVIPRTTTNPLRIASPLGGSVAPLLGQLDELVFFDRALTGAEVSQLLAYDGVVCRP